MQLIDMYLEFMFSTATVKHKNHRKEFALLLPYSNRYNLESIQYVVAYLIKVFQTQYENTKILTVFNFSIYKLQIDRLTVHFEKRQLLMSLTYEPMSIKEINLAASLKKELTKAAPDFEVKIGKDNW